MEQFMTRNEVSPIKVDGAPRFDRQWQGDDRGARFPKNEVQWLKEAHD